MIVIGFLIIFNHHNIKIKALAWLGAIIDAFWYGSLNATWCKSVFAKLTTIERKSLLKLFLEIFSLNKHLIYFIG